MQDTDGSAPKSLSGKKLETIAEQYDIVKKRTTKSHVMQYGDLTMAKEPILDYEGDDDK